MKLTGKDDKIGITILANLYVGVPMADKIRWNLEQSLTGGLLILGDPYIIHGLVGDPYRIHGLDPV